MYYQKLLRLSKIPIVLDDAIDIRDRTLSRMLQIWLTFGNNKKRFDVDQPVFINNFEIGI
ncbi:MAG: hypothetical protein EAZ39_13015 [Oscillatoriales cyanobacterium]|nr:MAG: hypothetical protein EAZ45_18815 [Oscillatoriales cyanobacterium]TAG17576.1 MAG: hypothetical protein EAZ39_13015 [Oscillatoriales cyanobacterium]TAG47541.1 MAG: hypothetical protein EAZ33_04500 [Oscillatoriales cyanobacterium]TAG53551.1 MAG: hypothetical protein EAZ28_27210 [Oscillatoriales cyanobacterium]